MAAGDGSHVGDVYLDVHPDASGFEGELKGKLAKLDDVKASVVPDISKFKSDLKAKLKAELAAYSADVSVAPDTTKFEGLLRKQLAKLPSFGVKVTPDTSTFKADLDAKLKKLGAVTVNVDADTAGAAAEIAALTRLNHSVTINVDADTAAATGKLTTLGTLVAGLSSVDININATVTGTSDVRAMATALARVRTAAAGGNIDINVNTTVTGSPSDMRAMANAVTRMRAAAAGGDIDINVNATVTGAIADLRRVATALTRLRAAATGPIDIDVDVQATGAIAQLATVSRAVRSLDRGSSLIGINIAVAIRPPGIIAELTVLHGILSRLRGFRASPNVSVGTNGISSARGAIQLLIAAAIGIAPAIIPAVAAAVAAIGAIGPAAFAGAAGIGVLALAFHGVFDAVSALGEAQSKSAKSGAEAANRARQIASAQDQVRDAHRGVQEAERDLANAQKDALRAQQDINRARQEAKDALEDLDSAVKNNSLSIRQANLDLADAEKELKAVQNLPVDNRQRIEAQLRYDQAKQNLDDLTTRQGRLAKEQQEATKKGIEGSDQVRDAQAKAADAQERVHDATVSLQRAQEQVVSSQRDLKAAIQSTSASGGSAVDTLKEKMAALSPAGQAFAKFLFGLKDEFKQLKGAAEAGLFPGLQRGIEAMLPILPQITLFVSRVAQAMGGLAEAAGRALASPFWSNFFDLMGQVAAPLLQALGGVIGGLARGFASLLLAFTPFSIQFTQGLASIAQAFAKWAAGLATSNGFTSFIDYVKTEGPKVLKLFGDLVIALIKLGIALAPLGTLVLNGLVYLFDAMANAKPGVLIAIAAAFGAIALAVIGLGGPITAVVAALVAIAGAAAYAYAHFEPFHNAVNTFVGFLRDVGIAVFTALKTAFTTFVDAFKEGGDKVTQGGFLGILQVQAHNLRDVFDYLKAGVVSFLDAFKKGGDDVQQGGFTAYMANLGMVARNLFDWLKTTGIPALQDFLTWLGPKLADAAKVAWTVLETFFGVLNKVFGFIWDNRETIGNVFTAIGTVIKVVFEAAGAIISTWWNYWVQPIFKAVAFAIENVLAPVFTWLWHNIIEPAWTGIKFAIDVAWAAIQVIFGFVQIAVKALGLAFSVLYEHAIKPAWEAISSVISTVWNSQIRPILETVGSFIGEHVAPAFSKGVDALKSIWGGISDGFRVVVKFVVEDLLNNGLLKAYNTIAKIFNVKPDDVSITVPGVNKAAPAVNSFQGHAAGGFITGPGTGTSDSIMARLSNGEYVIPAAIVKSFGVDFFDWLIGRKKAQGKNQKPGDGSEGLAFANGGLVPGFADGGLVGWITGSMKSLWNTFTDPIKTVKDKILAYMADNVPGFGKITEVATGASKKLIDGVLNYLGGKIANQNSAGYQGPISADVAAVQNWLWQQNGKPYVWAAAGPGGYDCSGIVSAVFNALHGKNPYNHTFSTHYQAPYFPKTNQVGILTAGWANSGERGGGSVGHTSANLAGLPFESTGSRGVHVGVNNGVTPYTNFAHWGSSYRNGGLVKIPYLYRDGGGHIPPGLSLVDNQTGRNEWVFNEAQTRDMVGAGTGGRGGSGELVHIDQFNAYANQSVHEVARDLDWQIRHRG